MNNDVQVMDVVESLKIQIAELSYQVAYKDGVIKSKDRRIEQLEQELELAKRRKKANEAITKTVEG